MANQVSIFQTIQTKWISPTNFKGTRISAKSASGIKIVRGYDYSLNISDNHAKVAQELQEKLNWTGKNYGNLIGGQNVDGSYTWVLDGSLQEVCGPKYVCAVCGVDGPNHGHYDVHNSNTHKFVAQEVK